MYFTRLASYQGQEKAVVRKQGVKEYYEIYVSFFHIVQENVFSVQL